MSQAELHDRRIPALALAAICVMLALHHRYVVTEQAAFLMALTLLPALGALALGGVIYPPVFYSVGPKGKELPLGIKAIGVTLALAGLAGGLYVFKFVYGF